MNFPSFISFTLTNKCNLRCRMCGQWSDEGYMRSKPSINKTELELAVWKRLVDEIAQQGVGSILLRGGEPFFYPQIIELLRYINSKNIFISIDTNGTMLEKFVADIVDIEKIHLTISIDGPREVHDSVRGLDGCFERIKNNINALQQEEKKRGIVISKSLNFTISPYSYRGLGLMPDTARELGINEICIVPFYYITGAYGAEYEKIMKEKFNCSAYSWKGFHHDQSGIDPVLFEKELTAYKNQLGTVSSFPYMPLGNEEYRTWFTSPDEVVVKESCGNVEKLIDIQPGGEANFCVDFPDYSIGNVKEATILELWNNDRANAFREYRRKKQLPVCYRCGAKYMADLAVENIIV